MNPPQVNIEAPPLTSAVELVHPPKIPDHELLRRIGRGAYGEVWLARSVTGAYRAVKIVSRHSFDHDRPFEREFSGILKFEPISRQHESQVDILHVGRGEDYFYYVMELADDQASGQRINPASYAPKTIKSELLQRGKLPFEECLKISLALTTALEHLHSQGLVHRDVKPSNIIFIKGVPKLADIGLVTSVDATRSYVGTEGFAPPEGPGTPQGDLYSLGKVLYELATGKDRQDFPELPTNLIELPDREKLVELNAVIAHACREEPRQRYQTATQMHADLLLLSAGKSVRRRHSYRQRLGTLAKIAAVAAMVGLLILGMNSWLGYRLKQLQERPVIGTGRLANQIPERDHRATLNQIDLAHYYNVLLTEHWFGPEGNNFSALPRGWQRFAGVDFDVRGLIQLASFELELGPGGPLPKEVQGIKVGLRCQRLHFLHGTVSGANDGREIGHYLVTYANGEKHAIPIRYGIHVRDSWHGKDSPQATPEAEVAWTGQNAATRERGFSLRIFRQTWDNPHPNTKIAHLDFVGGTSYSAPFLLALSAETPASRPAEGMVDALAPLRAHMDVFERLQPGTVFGQAQFRRVPLNTHGIKAGNRYYDAIRFTTPATPGWDLVWAFTALRESRHENWGIWPATGSMRIGFEDWYHGSTTLFQNFKTIPETKGRDLIVQFLAGKKLRPNTDYLIWFSFASTNAETAQMALNFIPSGKALNNQVESLEAALGLSRSQSPGGVPGAPAADSRNAFQTNCPPGFHRHFCLGQRPW